MKKPIILILATLLISASLGACTTSQRQNSGMVLGGVAGGYAGSALTGGSTLGTIAGAVGGGYVGRQVAQ